MRRLPRDDDVPLGVRSVARPRACRSALVWASGALTSTTDAVKIYNNDEDGTLVDVEGGDDPAEWEFEYTATSASSSPSGPT